MTDCLLRGSTFHEVCVYDNLTFDEQYSKPVRFANGDVRDHDKLRKYLQWADVVVWLAALVGDGACRAREAEAVDINFECVKFLAENFNGRILFTSTCSVYGAQDGVLTEESPLNPLSIYAQTKMNAESVLAKKNAVIMRYGTLFGMSDHYSRVRFDLVVNSMTRDAHRNRLVRVFGGDQWRPLLHVRDAARLSLRMAMECSPGIYNLHSTNRQINEIADTVKCVVGDDVSIDHTEMSTVDARNYRVLSGRAHMLGYVPVTSVHDGVVEMNELLMSGRIRNPYSDRYTNEAYLKNDRDKE